MTDQIDYNLKIASFYKRLETNFRKKKPLPKELYLAVQFDELHQIYDGILHSPKLLNIMERNLKRGMPVRIPKEWGYFTRTVNIIFDSQTNDICLIVETKRKQMYGRDKSIVVPRCIGTHRTVKPAFRIDTPNPIKYANAVFYIDGHYFTLERATNELLISKNLSLRYPNIRTHLHSMSMGAVFEKEGFREGDFAHGYHKKVSFYSKWAHFGDLRNFLGSPTGLALTVEKRDELAMQLLTAILLMHEDNKIHQDIKLDNILIFKRLNGSIYLELTDFGLTQSEDPKTSFIATACIGSESPEISALHYFYRGQSGIKYDYFHDSRFFSYGRQVFLEKLHSYHTHLQSNPHCFYHPHPANDMWSAGIVLDELYKSTYSTPEGRLKRDELIMPLLNPDRNKRLTAKQAFFIQKEDIKRKAQQKRNIPKVTFTAGYNPQFNMLKTTPNVPQPMPDPDKPIVSFTGYRFPSNFSQESCKPPTVTYTGIRERMLPTF